MKPEQKQQMVRLTPEKKIDGDGTTQHAADCNIPGAVQMAKQGKCLMYIPIDKIINRPSKHAGRKIGIMVTKYNYKTEKAS
jgi:hypothetical protein